jgi:hypothetical protein
MNVDQRKLEDTIDAGLQALGAQLDAPALRPSAIERIRAAVLAEVASRPPLRRARPRLATWYWAAIAACIAFGLAWPLSSRPARQEMELDSEGSIADWIVAAGESADQITMLLEGEWSAEGARDDDRARDALDEALDSLDDSLATVEGVFGA